MSPKGTHINANRELSDLPKALAQLSRRKLLKRTVVASAGGVLGLLAGPGSSSPTGAAPYCCSLLNWPNVGWSTCYYHRAYIWSCYYQGMGCYCCEGTVVNSWDVSAARCGPI
jgi:hypothetical protein